MRLRYARPTDAQALAQAMETLECEANWRKRQFEALLEKRGPVIVGSRVYSLDEKGELQHKSYRVGLDINLNNGEIPNG